MALIWLALIWLVTYNQSVSPRDYIGQVSAWHFTHATCSYCRSQALYLHDMQVDLDTNDPLLDIDILAVNYVGHESGIPVATSGSDIPWLQDTVTADVVGSWNPTYRDVVILDANNRVFFTFNLTTHNLSVSDNYDALRQKLIDAAAVPEPSSFLLLGLAGLSYAVMKRWKWVSGSSVLCCKI